MPTELQDRSIYTNSYRRDFLPKSMKENELYFDRFRALKM